MSLKRKIAQRAANLAFRIPAIRETATRELTTSLRVIADVGARRCDYLASEQWATAGSPLLRELLEQIGSDLIGAAQQEIKNGLRLLRPYAANGFGKARFGSPHDGGYVLIDDFRTVDTAFSFGIDQNAEWDLAVAQRGVTVYQFDHTVDGPPIIDPRLIFTRKKIAAADGPDSASLSSLLHQHDKRNIAPNILLKIDIECDEWAIFDAAPPAILRRFSQIVGEFHFFEGFSADARWRQLITRVLRKLTDHFAVVHIHANNHGDFHNVGDLTLPNALEITFANRDLYSFRETDEPFPGALDAPNDPARLDVKLDIFRL